jgi:hypothetical protein
MSAMRREGRRAVRRAFRPEIGGPLEDRVLLSTGRAEIDEAVRQALADRRAQVSRERVSRERVAPRANGHRDGQQRHPIQTLVRNGGRGVRILDGAGDAFDVVIDGTGTVTARPMPEHDGRVKIIARGTTSDSILLIAPANPAPTKGGAHTFNPAFGVGDELLEVGEIVIRSGRIGQVLGFRSVNLSGPLRVRGESTVDRIAVNRLLPGATIETANDLNTLDVFVDATLSGPGTGIFVGRDLNWVNVRGNLTLQGGATVNVGRDLGLLTQPTKGSAVGGKGMLVQGNFVIDPGSQFVIDRNLAGPVEVRGNFNGTSRFVVQGQILAPVTVLGNITAQ